MSGYSSGYFDGKTGRPYEPSDFRGNEETEYANGFAAGRDYRDTHQTVKHTHVAGTVIGQHIDTCALCGQDLRCDIHTSVRP